MTDLDQELSALEDSLGGGASDKDAQAIEAIAMAAKKAQEAVAEFEVPPQETSAQMTKRWTKYAKEHLKGRKIKDVRYMTSNEASDLEWNCRTLVIELDNGTLLYPTSDDEGNDAGALFGATVDGNLTFPVLGS